MRGWLSVKCALCCEVTAHLAALGFKAPQCGGTSTLRRGTRHLTAKNPAPYGEGSRHPTAKSPSTLKRRAHHSVYVVYLRNPKGDGKAGYYVGMTGLTPAQRFQNHKAGIK